MDQVCKYCRKDGHWIRNCPKLHPVDDWPPLSGNVQTKAEAREQARMARKKAAHGGLKARRKQQRALAESKEQSSVLEKEDCSTCSIVLFANEDEVLFWEDMEKDSALHAKWDQEDKERQERRKGMTKEEKRQEDEDYEDTLQTAYDNEQTANEYYKLYGMFTS
jgi:hypothetical protein